MRIRIYSRSRGFVDQNWRKMCSWKKLIFFQKLQLLNLKNDIFSKLQYLGLNKELPSYRRSLQPSKEKSSTSKLFVFLCVIFALLDPDPADQCGSMRIRIRNQWAKLLGTPSNCMRDDGKALWTLDTLFLGEGSGSGLAGTGGRSKAPCICERGVNSSRHTLYLW